MERIQHEVMQNSPEWYALLLETDGASETAAMLGLSKNITRTELLHAKHSGIAKEFSDFVQERILDHGHEVEALARPMAEEIIGEELYPQTWTYGKLRASTDGLTMDGTVAWEHKQWAKDLAASVARGELPDKHQPQCQQIMLVTGAEQVLFMVSDGTPENCVHMFVKPNAKWFDRIKAGWAIFHQDLDHYQPVEVIPAAVAAPVMALPALSIQVAIENGMMCLTDNIAIFGAYLKSFIAEFPEKPSNDQDVVNRKAACKTLQDAQDRLDAAEAQALGQIAPFDAMQRTKELYWALARTTRLAWEKDVEAAESKIKLGIVTKARTAYAEHMAALAKRIGHQMPGLPENFAVVIKGLRTTVSLQNAVDTELARCKIASNEVADRIQVNLTTLRELAADHDFLFADTAQIVLKESDDLTALVKLRISEHQAAEAKRLEDERAKIRAEEEAKAEAKIKAEQEAIQKQEAEQQKAMAVQVAQEIRAPGKSAEAEDTGGRGLKSHPVPAVAPVQTGNDPTTELAESLNLVRTFLDTRDMPTKTRNEARAILVEFVKFSIARKSQLKQVV